MTDQLALDLVDKELVTDQLVLTVSYDIENLKDPDIKRCIRVKFLQTAMAGRLQNMPMAQ